MNENILYTDRRTYITFKSKFLKIPFVYTKFYPIIDDIGVYGWHKEIHPKKNYQLEIILTIKLWFDKK